MFALCDVNSFYASCETVFRPDLKAARGGVVNNDGCVIARARRQSLVKMGEPYFKLKDRFRQSPGGLLQQL
jgi:DNA polymerase V